MDAAINYETLKLCLKTGLSFAAYTLANESTFNLIIQKTSAQELDKLKHEHKGFIIHPFKITINNPLILINNDFHYKEGDNNHGFLDFINSVNVDLKKNDRIFTETDKIKYLDEFDYFKRALDSNKFKKLVLSRVKNIPINTDFEITELFKDLNTNYKSSFNYLLFTPHSGIWLGASPEVLLNINSNRSMTYALAGTQKKQDIELSKYDWGLKEIEEQKFVFDFVEQTLSRHISKEDLKKSSNTIEAGKMVHLRTCFQFPTKSLSNSINLINDLHPTEAGVIPPPTNNDN